MPRTNQTKALLAKSLQELMATTPLEKITVNDIVEQANVGRNTFYYHFEDKYDLVNWYFQTEMTRFLFERETIDSNWKSLLESIAAFFRENKAFYTNAFGYVGQNNLQEYIFHYYGAIFTQRLVDVRPNVTAFEKEFMANFLAGAFMGVLVPWVRGGMRGEISEGHHMLNDLHQGNLLQTMLDLDGYNLGEPDRKPPVV